MRDTKPALRPQEAPLEKKIFKRRRCQNCNKLYMPSREDQKFCRDLPDPDKCRKEYYRYGSSYGSLKTGLHKAIDKKYAELEKQMRGTIRTFALSIQVLTNDILDLRRRVADLDSTVHPVPGSRD